MKLVIQRVSSAEVKVGEETIGKIGTGLFVLVGVGNGDGIPVSDILAEKLSKLRIMSDKNGKMNLSIKEVNSEILVVSQFTLYADTSGGNRPSFVKAENPAIAKEIYEHFIGKLKSYDLKVENGKFGEYMKIDANLDGPITIIIDSNNK